MKLIFVAGTRPEIIKLAPVIQCFHSQGGFDIKLCVTGQHKEMAAQMLSVFDLTADFDLDLMKNNQGLNELAAGVFQQIDPVLEDFQPDWLIVQGDTTTAMTAAIVAFNRKIMVGHVEAGLRSHDMGLPWPEEANRKIIGSIASKHFSPTEVAVENLKRENVNQQDIFLTGNTVIDALIYMKDKIEHDKELGKKLANQFSFLNPNKKLILVTGHRRESFGEGHSNIFKAVREIAQRDDVQIIYPVHLNPNVKDMATAMLNNYENIHLIEPVDYQTLVFLLKTCYLVVTDSGGIQEEAPTFSKPVLVTRTVTERMEGVLSGSAKLVGTDKNLIIAEASQLLDDKEYYLSFAKNGNPYGDGKAAQRIYSAFCDLKSMKNKESVYI